MIKPDPDPANEIFRPVVFQWSTEKRLKDIRVTLLHMVDAVPSDSREVVEKAAEKVFDGALQILLPEDRADARRRRAASR